MNDMPCQCIRGGDGAVSAPSIFSNGLNGIIFCIALPLACLEVFSKGIFLFFRLLMSLSFACCVWIVLTAVAVILFLCVAAQCAAATLG
ncbi:MAG TPA: hypothetical protein ENK84_11880 [Desulfobulbus sp.]|nr:hypothetical protein [Desulfobulbus sp.]